MDDDEDEDSCAFEAEPRRAPVSRDSTPQKSGIHAPQLEPYIVYKVGDLGMATMLSEPHVDEGDCRYLAKVGWTDISTNLLRGFFSKD